MDGNGHRLYEIKKTLSLHRTMEGKNDHHHIFQVQNHKTQRGDDHETTMTGWWEDKNGNHKFAIKGNWWKGDAVIWLTEENQSIGAVVVVQTNVAGDWGKEAVSLQLCSC